MTKNIILQPFERAGRAEAREVSLGNGPQTFFIAADALTMRPGANWRCPSPYQTQEEFEAELAIPELAANIYSNSGPAEPLIGDLEKGTGKFFVSEGQRRMLAIRRLLEQGTDIYPSGKAIAKVEVRLNPPDFTEEDRLKLNYTTQNKMKLKPSQLAFGFKQVKDTVLVEGKPITNEQIATNYGVSRQMIDNYLKIAELDGETLKKLDYGEISQANALNPLRKHRESKEFVPGGFTTMRPEMLHAPIPMHELPVINQPQIGTYTVDESVNVSNGIVIPTDNYTFSHQLDDKDIPIDSERNPLLIRNDDIVTMGWIDNSGLVCIPSSDKWTEEQKHALDEMGYDVPTVMKTYTPVKIDTTSSLQAEEDSRKTSRKLPEQVNTERKEAEEAMRGLDYRPDKEAAEMGLNEVMKLMDKLNVQAGHLPNTLKQAKDDMSGLIVFIQSKIKEVIDLVKKAPEKHY